MGLKEVWVLLAMLSIILMMLSFYEVRRITDYFKITKKLTKLYIQFGLLAFWGFITLIALGKAGVG